MRLAVKPRRDAADDQAVAVLAHPGRRASPRSRVALDVTLVHGHSRPVAARTIDVGTGGMRIRSTRPLPIDALVGFRLAAGDGAQVIDGRAHVVREHPGRVYALRFEPLGEARAERLGRLVAGAMLPVD